MTIPLPNLDDRRWGDLVEEGRALIPLYGPDWTDHNIHDPGIMLMELLAWETEKDLYWLNRIPDEHRRKFLALAGIEPRPPKAASTILRLQLKVDADPLLLPKTTEFLTENLQRTALNWQTLHEIVAVPGQIAAVQRRQGGQFTDLTPAWLRGEQLLPLGDDPQEGAEFYIGLTEALPPEETPTIYFHFAGAKANDEERHRIKRELAQQLWCRTQLNCEDGVHSRHKKSEAQLVHHDVHLQWAYLAGGGQWRPLDVQDDTRALTLNGPLVVQMPKDAAMDKQTVGSVPTAHYYLRIRLQRGKYDKAPSLMSVALNGVAAQQAQSAGVSAWTIVTGAVVPAQKLSRGQPARLNWHEDEQGQIVDLFHDDSAPALRVLYYQAPFARFQGKLVLEVEQLAPADGRPWQEYSVAQPSILSGTLQLATRENNHWRKWLPRPDFDASSRIDAHFVVDTTAQSIRFGDGEHGRVVPGGATIWAGYRSTQAESGNMPANRSLTINLSEHNRAIFSDLRNAKDSITDVINVIPASAGAAAESIDQAAGRTLQQWQATQQAVTEGDYKKLALQTPGVQLARVAVRPNFHPTYPCFYAPGVVTLIVLPYLPLDRPSPSLALRKQVAAYLERRRILGTRIEVAGPNYKKVAVRAEVRACRGSDTTNLHALLKQRVDDLFHPLWGGPMDDGWPFGRDVYRSEVLHVLDKTPGVDHVLSLELIADGCEPQCGNVCLGPLGLVDAGEHEFQVLAWQADAADCTYDDSC